jgi:DNA-binding PadR family transcriptional regulator
MAAPSRIDILVLASLARIPMHGYELKLELQYKHVRWWAKCEHGHLYAALKRLEDRGWIRGKDKRIGGRDRRVFSITAAGRRWLADSLRELATSDDATYFDVDLFLSSSFTMEQGEFIALLEERRGVLERQLAGARQLRENLGELIPAVGRLIMEHRIEHLEREIEFERRAAAELEKLSRWGPFLGDESIVDFLERTQAAVEK